MEGIKPKKVDINSGSLIFGGNETVKSKIDLIEYNKELLTEEKFEKCRKFTNKDTVKWINVMGFSYIEIQEIDKCFKLHPLVLEDIKQINALK